jgi:hypothetical protein
VLLANADEIEDGAEVLPIVTIRYARRVTLSGIVCKREHSVPVRFSANLHWWSSWASWRVKARL